jgi:hypothetical protein
MSTQTDSNKTTEEYMKSSSKWFSKSAIAMAEMYKKQFQMGYDMYANMFNAGSTTEKNKTNYSFDLFHSNIEMLKNNFENISKLSEKTILNFMNSLDGEESKSDDNIKILEAIMDGYHLQTKQIAEINQRFFETYSKTFKSTNQNAEKSYDIFRKKTEENFHKAEEVINKAVKTYSSNVNNSAKNRQELLDNINNQMELLIKNSLKQWSDLTETTGKENKTPEKKTKEKKTKINK